MCVAFIKRAHNKILVALNRDEFYARPTTSLHYIEDKKIYAGVDKRYGGTWFAMDGRGRFAFVTNIRNKELAGEGRPTRGELPILALEGGSDFLDAAGKYNPFNLVWGDRNRVFYYNNVEDKELELKEDLMAFSNGPHPCNWPKTVEGKNQFKKVDLDWDDDRIFEKSFEIMSNEQSYDFVAAGTGFDPEIEKKLTPVFLRMGDYGTVSTTVFLAGADGVRIDEKRWPSGEDTKFVLRPH